MAADCSQDITSQCYFYASIVTGYRRCSVMLMYFCFVNIEIIINISPSLFALAPFNIFLNAIATFATKSSTAMKSSADYRRYLMT